jgi:hypothetical protein
MTNDEIRMTNGARSAGASRLTVVSFLTSDF